MYIVILGLIFILMCATIANSNIGMKILIHTLVYFGWIAIIDVAWQALEIIECGKINPSYADEFIGALFALAMYVITMSKIKEDK